jgi:hypothetical protein
MKSIVSIFLFWGCLFCSLFLDFKNTFAQFDQMEHSSIDENKKNLPLFYFKLTKNIELIGYLHYENQDETKITTLDNREVIIPSSEILFREEIEKSKFTNPLEKNPNVPKYFLAQPAFTINKGSQLTSGNSLLMIKYDYGIADNFSIGFSSSILLSPIWVQSKYSYSVNPTNHFSVGGMFGSLTYLDPTFILTSGVVTYTYGNLQTNYSITGGFAKTREFQEIGILNLGFQQFLVKNASLTGEFWFIPKFNVITGGLNIRLYENQNNSIDLGISYFSLKNVPGTKNISIFYPLLSINHLISEIDRKRDRQFRRF